MPKVILGYPKLVYLSCLQVNQVSHHPCIPCTQYQSSKDHNFSVQIGTHRINRDFSEPTNPFSIPMFGSHFLESLGGLKKKWQDHRGLIWQCGAVAVCDHPLNCQSGGLRRLESTFSLVGSVSTSAKESIGGG